MIKVITVATQHVDSDGDRIMPGAIKGLPKKVLLTHNFNPNEPLGHAVVDEECGELKAAIPAELAESHAAFYPAIGFSLVKWHDENGVRVIDEMKLHTVALCEKPNIDLTIKPIGEQ